MKKILAVLALITGVRALLVLGTTAQAKPAPAPQPYVLDQEIIKETATPADGAETPTKIVLTCPPGKVVTGGGFDSGSTYAEPILGSNDSENSPIRRSYPSAADAWTVEFDPERQGMQPVTGYAICVAAAAPTS